MFTFVIIILFKGYYRVNYDDATWAAIDKVLYDSPTTIHVLNRAQVENCFFLNENILFFSCYFYIEWC